MSEPKKVLRRIPNEGQLTGVCAGLAYYLGVDVTMVRIAAIGLALITSGGFVVAYVLMAIIMPSSTAAQHSSTTTQNLRELTRDVRSGAQQHHIRNIVGLGLILLGAWLLINQLFPGIISQNLDYIWPIVLILLGIVIATRRKW